MNPRWQCFNVRKVIAQTLRASDGVLFAWTYTDGQRQWYPDDLPIGAMWIDANDGLTVQLPGRCTWAIDQPGSRGPGGVRATWTRSGEPPIVTVLPSINFLGIYHGWVSNGWVSDDVEGRRFDDLGKALR